jgi:hypothetical protein
LIFGGFARQINATVNLFQRRSAIASGGDRVEAMLREFLRLTACFAVVATTVGCHSDPGKPLGPADSYLLFAPVAGTLQGALPVVRRLDIKDEAVQPLPRLLESSFAFEMLRTAYLAKQFVREASVDGQRFTAAAQRNAAEPTCLVLGIDRQPYGLGLALPHTFGGPQPRPRLPWIGLPADPSADKALVQTLAGRLATYIAHFVATGGSLADVAAPPPILVDGYRIAMEVIAREWREGSGPAGVIQVEEGSTAQREIFANVRENRYVLAQDGTTLRDARELIEDPGVAATVIHRMAQSRALAGRVAPEAFYAPFASNRFPPGVSPAAVLGTFRNFQAKFLGAWATAVLRGHAPRDVIDLVDLYGATFPAERAEAVRIFVVTTFGATAKAGGVSTKPQYATRALAELTALTAEVVAARRSLREALVPSSADAGTGPGRASGHGH